MKIKTSELSGPALDWAVAQVMGIRTYVERYRHTMTGRCVLDADLVDMETDGEQELRFSRDWAQGGPIIEREEIGIKRNAPCSKGREWEASPSITAKGAGGKYGYGPTPLIAAMRGYVASKLGDEIEIPEELV